MRHHGCSLSIYKVRGRVLLPARSTIRPHTEPSEHHEHFQASPNGCPIRQSSEANLGN